MKRLATLLLAAGLIFGTAQASHAIEFKGSGIFEAYFGWSNVENDDLFPGDPASASSDRFRPSQRLRLQLEMIASENLRGVFQIENNILWGQSDPATVGGGGAVGGDGYNVQVRHAYLDWAIPSTDVQVRIGLQPFALPGMVAGTAILDDDVAGIVIAKTFNENIAANLFWTRAYADNVVDGAGDTIGGHDAVDLFGLILAMTFDGFNVTPWAMYGQTGKEMGGWKHIGPNNQYAKVNDGDGGTFTNLPDADVWYAGITAELVAFDPFRLAIDFNYGAADTDARLDNGAGNFYAAETSGYYLAGIAEYTLDMMTPGILAWYASGDDHDAETAGGGMMPVISGAWTGTSFGFGDYFGSGNNSVEVFGTSPVGTWGGALQLKDLSFMDNMSHLVRVAYYTGTNHADARNLDTYKPSTTYLTEDDTAWEINVNTQYDIYENLSFILELGYIGVDWDNTHWVAGRGDDAYRVNASFGYSF